MFRYQLVYSTKSQPNVKKQEGHSHLDGAQGRGRLYELRGWKIHKVIDLEPNKPAAYSAKYKGPRDGQQ